MSKWQRQEYNSRPFYRDAGGVDRWRKNTPKVLQDAIKDCWDGKGTPAQKRLLKNWVIARVMDCPIDRYELLLAHLDAKRRKGA